MDFVSRLKFFLESRGVTSTQFADTCGIPRPTVSQILNGRNKKISDEIIGKIHSAFPSLSVLWLMFGEGAMESVSNIQLSAAQNSPNMRQNTTEAPNNQPKAVGGSLFEADSNLFSENFNPELKPVEGTESSKQGLFGIDKENAGRAPSEISQDENENNRSIEAEHPCPPARQIVNVLVFYDDNTFKSFIPANNAHRQ